jgi:hypothetical protein
MKRVVRTKNLAVDMTAASLEAKATLSKQNISLPSRPRNERPGLPSDLTTLTDDDLMELFVHLTHWQGYFAGHLAIAEIDERCAEAVMEKAQAMVLLSNWTGPKEDRVVVAKAQRDTDPEVTERRDEHLRRYAIRKLTAMLFGNSERDASVVSRELSRRIGRQEVHDRRVSKWTP